MEYVRRTAIVDANSTKYSMITLKTNRPQRKIRENRFDRKCANRFGIKKAIGHDQWLFYATTNKLYSFSATKQSAFRTASELQTYGQIHRTRVSRCNTTISSCITVPSNIRHIIRIQLHIKTLRTIIRDHIKHWLCRCEIGI